MGQSEHKVNKQWLGFGICFLFNILTISVVGYGAFYAHQKFERMQEANEELRHDVDAIRKVIQSPKT